MSFLEPCCFCEVLSSFQSTHSAEASPQAIVVTHRLQYPAEPPAMSTAQNLVPRYRHADNLLCISTWMSPEELKFSRCKAWLCQHHRPLESLSEHWHHHPPKRETCGFPSNLPLPHLTPNESPSLYSTSLLSALFLTSFPWLKPLSTPMRSNVTSS